MSTMVDAIEKRFFSSERARLIQDQASTRNLDSKIRSSRFDCCVFAFYSFVRDDFFNSIAIFCHED